LSGGINTTKQWVRIKCLSSIVVVYIKKILNVCLKIKSIRKQTKMNPGSS